MSRRGWTELERAVERALASLDLGSEVPAHDGWLDPAALAAALGHDGAVLMRARRREVEAEQGFATVPQDGVWLVVEQGSVRAAPLRGVASSERRATRVVLRTMEEICCDAPRCHQQKHAAELVIVLDDDQELILVQTLAAARDAALAPCAAVAAPLARRLGLPFEGSEPAPDALDTPAGTPLCARELARWSLGREGDLFVLRDLASRGPRELARRETIVALLIIGGALASGYLALAAWGDWERLAITGAIALVLALAGFAMVHIARWSAKYSAKSAALLWMGRDRLVVSPWVSRNGAVDLKPEGRYGAAVPLSEVQAIDVARRSTGWTIGCRTEHGPFEIGTRASEAEARLWCAALRRLAAATACARPARTSTRPLGAHHAALALFLVCAGCNPKRPPPPPVSTAVDPLPAESSEVAAVSARPVSSAVPVAEPVRPKLAMIEDDLKKAMAQAQSTHKVVFVEVWAPWCHTCLSMKSFVLPDPAIVALADRVVFAAVDSDKEVNAEFMEKYAVNAWPTLYVLDTDGKVLGMWQGAASVEELRELIHGALDARSAAHDPRGPVAALLDAKRAHARRDYHGAARHYQTALERGGSGWARGSEALHGLLFSAYRLAQWDRCAKLGADHVAAIEGAALPTDFSYLLLSCAGRSKNAALAKQAREAALARLRSHTERPPPASSIDDRADALNLLAETLRAQGDKDGARAALEKQIAMLEKAAAEAPGPEAAATFDYQRMNTYLALGRGEEAVRMLRRRAKELSDNYEPPARLAQALSALGRHQEALVAIDDALGKAYGPRKIGYYATRARIAAAIGDKATEKKSLADLLAHYAGLEPALKREQHLREQVDAARARLRKLP